MSINFDRMEGSWFFHRHTLCIFVFIVAVIFDQRLVRQSDFTFWWVEAWDTRVFFPEGAPHLILLLGQQMSPILLGIWWIVKVEHCVPFINQWIKIGMEHICHMPWVCPVIWSKSHVFTRFDHWLRLAIQIKGAILTITRSKLLTCNREGTILTIPNKNRAARGPNNDLWVGDIIYLNLIAMVEEKDLAVWAVWNIERLALNSARLLGEGCRILVTKRILCLHLIFSIKRSICEDFTICCNECLHGDNRRSSVNQAWTGTNFVLKKQEDEGI